ncbi:MAG: hypothetical protein M9894_09705 [Planctomycetes bacterium]|nr:hypothetical protein [Planctomycetota bacterium]
MAKKKAQQQQAAAAAEVAREHFWADLDHYWDTAGLETASETDVELSRCAAAGGLAHEGLSRSAG